MGWAADRLGRHIPAAIGGVAGLLLFIFMFNQRLGLVTHLERLPREGERRHTPGTEPLVKNRPQTSQWPMQGP